MTVALAREVAARVAALDGVVAVTLGGSLARGRADRRSDVDLGLYYDRPCGGRSAGGHAPVPVGGGLRRDDGPWGGTPPGFADGVDAALSGLGAEPAMLERPSRPWPP